MYLYRQRYVRKRSDSLYPWGERPFFIVPPFVFHKSWYKEGEKEAFEGPEVPGVGGEINDSFSKDFLVQALGRALGSGSAVGEGMEISKTSFLPPCYSKSGRAAD